MWIRKAQMNDLQEQSKKQEQNWNQEERLLKDTYSKGMNK